MRVTPPGADTASSSTSSKVVLITGAAHGIGECTARRLCSHGYRVALTDIDPRVLTVAQSLGDGARGWVADLVDPEAVAGLVKAAHAAWGRLDGIVNNAAFQRERADVVAEPIAVWERVINVCLRAPFLMVKYGVPLMMRQGAGAIVNVSSIHALRAYPHSPAYDTAKAGLNGFTRQIVLEYGAYGIRANSVLPGLIIESEASPEQIAHYPVGRVGRPEDVASVIEFLLDDALSGFISGAEISVDGGLMAYSPEVRPPQPPLHPATSSASSLEASLPPSQDIPGPGDQRAAADDDSAH